ncbi:uncharacterized protein LOC135837836 [Planococcus citri]|uniref:uncharacterized protein LOC135837836 n=1 Tax=Planococcus citri TaxID=170843 RepID=UPI0031F883DE
MDSEVNSKVTGPVHHRISKYYNVMVKVDDDVYYLDKFQLAWKSDYFEKLLIEYSHQQECISIELPLMDTKTFSTIVEIIYGQSLKSVLDQFNYVDLIMAMDYLQMEIDLRPYQFFIEHHCSPDKKIFKLYNFVRENPNLQWLLKSVFDYLSVHLADMRNNKDFLSIPFDHIMRIILGERTFTWDTPTTSRSDVLGVCQFCSEWICTSLENRLPHVAKLVNAVKRRFDYMNEVNDDDCNTMLSEITEPMNPKIMSTNFYKFLMCDGDIRANPAENLLEDESIPEDESIHEDESIQENVNLLKDEKKDVWTNRPESYDRKKLAKFVENNYFHDIVVTVGEKTYKLHRFILNSASGYFADISSTKQSNSSDVPCAEVSTQQPNKNETYSLRDVDQATFDMIIEYIYFGELQLTLETITRVLRAANFLKMETLFNTCVSWMEKHIEEVCAKVLLVDECMSTSWIVDNIEEIVSRFLTIPDTDDTLVICLISFDMLEDLLLSSTHCCDNPHQIVDVCSKWIFHDVENRYHRLPQIALEINRNRNYHKIEASTDLINYSSEQSIRDEFWKILNSTSVIPSISIEKKQTVGKKKWKEVPVFVAVSETTTTTYVLNANLEEIASLCLSLSDLYEFDIMGDYVSLAATLMDDNLFIMLCLDYDRFRFSVYNLSLKKFISLNNRVKVEKTTRGFNSRNTSMLLNCRGQVYCGFKLGYVLKYSFELNRWMMFSEKPVFSDGYSKDKYVWFTSDGDKLYRLYGNCISQSQNPSVLKYVVEEFDFQQNAWLSLSDIPFRHQPYFKVQNFTIIKGGQLAVILTSCFMSFNRNSRRWRELPLVSNFVSEDILEKSFLLTQCEDRLLHVRGDELYQWSRRNQTWQLKEELPSESESSVGGESSGTVYEYIRAIHRPHV